MKKLLIAAIIPIAFGMAAFSALPKETSFNPDPTPDTTLTATPDDGIDVLTQVNALNSGTKPNSRFNAGHISFTDINDYLTKTKDGFIVKLPSNTNVPTPTVHDGKVYVSGGFGSKQYYAFD